LDLACPKKIGPDVELYSGSKGRSIHLVVAADVNQQYTAVIKNPENDAI
jgi:hypothetical protein